MVGILEQLKDLHKSCNPCCIVDSCRRGRCRVYIDINEVVCIDCDICGVFKFKYIGTNERPKPDFVILYHNNARVLTRWVVLEMKGRVSSPGKIMKQLQRGADEIAQSNSFRLSKYPIGLDVVIIRDRHVRSSDFARRYITYFGKKVTIRIRRCQSKLSELIN